MRLAKATISVFVFAGSMFVAASTIAVGEGSARLTVRKSGKTGLATFVTAADGGAVPVRVRAGKQRPDPVDFLATHGELFGVTDPDKQLVVHKVQTDGLGHTHTTFQQVHKGVPVFSGVLKVHQDANGAVIVANGDFYPIGDKLNTVPTLDAEAAMARAKTVIGVGGAAVEHSELVIVDPGWYGDPPVGAHLAYYIILTDLSIPLREAFLVDAHSGRILDQWDVLHTSRYREVYDGEGLPDLPGVLVRAEGAPPAALTDANLAYDYAGDLYDYFFRLFGRDSINDAGMTLVSTVNSPAPGCPNAFWSGSQMVFCSGTVTDDITAHEIGHGITQYTANLIYQNQSGQLNESYSDIFGELIDVFNGNVAFPGPPGGTPWPTDPDYVSPGLDTPNNLRTVCSFSPDHNDGVRWLLGEDAVAFGGAIRDIWEPTCMGDPDRAYHPYQTCDPLDNGGVHSGSGIPNHAFAILTDGKTFNGQTVTGIGPIKAAAVWYRALTTYLTVASDFEDAYYALNQAATDLINATIKDPRDGSDYGQFLAADALEVDKALLAVEMNTEGACGATVPILDSTPRNKCTGAQSVFSDDFEGGIGGWTVSNSGPYGPPTPYDWVQISGGLPFGRSGIVWFAEDRNVGDCATQDESAVHSLFSTVIGLPVDLPSPTLSFTHYVETELGYDGGNVKISVNGGGWTVIPSSAFQYNPYNGALIGTNPLAGEEVWTGAGGRWGTSFIDSSGFVSGGETVQFRFDFGKDGCYGINGWFVDDFELYTCPPHVAKFSQPPTEAGEDIPSNIDWVDEAPNVVVADDFTSDGRPITAVRWWGSELLTQAGQLTEAAVWPLKTDSDSVPPITGVPRVEYGAESTRVPKVWIPRVDRVDATVVAQACLLQKLTAADGAASDRFGHSVAVSGDTAVIGAWYDDDLGTDSGSAYVFEKVGAVWTQTAKLTAADGAADDFLGVSVAVSGDTAVIGAFGDDDLGSNAGSAYVFEKVGALWTQTAKLTAEDGAADDQFGNSVAVSGETAVIGAFGDDDLGSVAGSAYVFEKVGAVWTQTAKLTAADGAAGDWLGVSVAVSGDTAVIGAEGDDDLRVDSGSAYVFAVGGDCSDNDNCLSAVGPLAVPSTTPGSTDLATVEVGFPSPCGTASITSPGVWYTVIGTGNTMTASLCNPATTYDSQVSVYCPDCATAVCVEGNDDLCGSQSEVSWCSESDQTYLILVHGAGGASGPFELALSDDGAACPNPPSCGLQPCGDPAAGDCCDPLGNGTPGCDDVDCCDLVCSYHAYCCEVEWDDICAGTAADWCGVCGAGVTCPGSGDCCDPLGNGTPGCEDADCCNLVCSQDAYCCEVEWDFICAEMAQAMCDVCGVEPAPEFDGWFISFHEPLVTGTPAQPALGVYFCDESFVETDGTSLQACDEHSVIEYLVDLAYCCLVYADVDSRTGGVPAQPGAFFEEQSLDYAIDIQAVIGREFVDDGEGTCVEVATGRSAVEDFWGWHSTSVESGTRGAVTTFVTSPGADWLYGPWDDVTPTCSTDQNMAFELLTPVPVGACCDKASGNCTEGLLEVDCDFVWFPGQTCNDTNCAGPGGGCLTQFPNQISAYFSDIDCDFCIPQPDNVQVLAENFVVNVGEEIHTLRFWGGYFPGNIPKNPDCFTVIFYNDSAGLPGTEINRMECVESDTRTATGIVVLGLDEYEYTIEIDPNKSLGPGTYWVEIYNDTSGNTDSWFWETGDLDPDLGIVTSAYSYTVPEPPWGHNPGVHLALEIMCKGRCASSSAVVPELVIDQSKIDVVNQKNRYLSFAVGDRLQNQIIRVKFVELAGDYGQFNDNYMWVGAPFQVTESPAHTAPGQPGYTDFWAAKLGCEKPIIATDWTTLTGDCHQGVCWHSENAGEACTDDSECVRAIIHLYGELVIPGSKYEIRVLDSLCPQEEIESPAIAPPLELATSMWGDVCGSFVNGQWSAADGECLVPNDVLAVLSKVAVHALAPSKTRADVIGPEVPKNMQPDLKVDIYPDVIRVLSACAARPFPAVSPAEWPCP